MLEIEIAENGIEMRTRCARRMHLYSRFYIPRELR